ncbi:aminotransferase class I/II-fold pyridoxal phosphate-dependent enzyme [Flavobacterium cellulosilyticum]|uniref:Pyridoxal phosphate-dependent aminotransferase family protein n=1 Tax=Flavobacterium cellulosilyticum TaxID=2541731 RepID=A0A4R5CB88_9FLAO|nr:aminotransferase class I/II-fold pyridoxal phosphate-dependent enzyme [Flavobacterium cellulosilyticum]TDD96016.1 pyridoxal phosphate-dependent aminotransferase family protein [Flavobacterium cellulosilyticum]
MTVENFPDRIIIIDNVEYLYFGGTNYLAMSTNIDFQHILFESIKKWGTAYGSSRNSNIKLSVYDIAEKILAKNMGTDTALAVSSGMIAGKFVLEYLSKVTNAIFHFPDTHPALMDSSSLPIIINGKLNTKIFDSTISKIGVLADSIPGFKIEPVDLKILLEIPYDKELFLVIDETHSFGIYGNEWQNYLEKDNIKIIKIASMGKALGLSGGVIASNYSIISEIRNQKTFIGSSGMNPAYLNTFVNAQELYLEQKQKLQQNLNYLDTHFINRNGFIFHASYPVIYFENASVTEKLLNNRIITTSFNYTNSSEKLNRIVITANHTFQDLDHLISQLNT